MKTIVLSCLLVLFSGAALAREYVSPVEYPQSDNPAEVNVIIEIPAGSITKYELDPETGYVAVDRYLSMPVAYPANYGSVPGTLAGDGDPLDLLVYTREPIVPGAVIKARPIGVLRMIDGGEEDAKVIGVPAGKIDPTYAGIKEITDLPAMERERLQAFFRVYKQLPEGGKVVELRGFGDAATARDTIAKARNAYRAKPEK